MDVRRKRIPGEEAPSLAVLADDGATVAVITLEAAEDLAQRIDELAETLRREGW
ncbi:hypothetical protein [Frondihabitans sp. VKM Ac-2883]|uniref:hypothetical protein n=1 Tax=Frondihabitans sp. VKM Ac-2883 TaxID=2783823 RepID=UPI00188BD2BF|nr:hypothetical protein [Frondihabitans sp. VKM Ac-2883]MBF4575052.1 hypothetical protein [Frondihabitans sp. VKM Ac-2883]